MSQVYFTCDPLNAVIDSTESVQCSSDGGSTSAWVAVTDTNTSIADLSASEISEFSSAVLIVFSIAFAFRFLFRFMDIQQAGKN